MCRDGGWGHGRGGVGCGAEGLRGERAKHARRDGAWGRGRLRGRGRVGGADVECGGLQRK